MSPASVAVVGGGIAGLVAAYRVRQALGPDATITLIEESDHVGGKLRTVPLAGYDIDVGAEAFVGRRPELPALLAELGLADQLVHPSGLRALVWASDALHPLPSGTLMGIPAGSESLVGLVDSATLDKIDREPTLPFEWDATADIDVESLVAARFGEQVVSRSVDPLLGGVYAGRSRTIGVRAALPTLAAALDAGASSLSAAVERALPEPSSAPVFGGIRDGYGVLLDALVLAATPTVLTGVGVNALRRDGDGWLVDPVGRFDGVVLAVPAPTLTRLLAEVSPVAADAARAIPVASSAVVALALPLDTQLPENSGILVATGEVLRAKAFTLSSQKWPHLGARDVKLVRASFGHFGDDRSLGWPDDELVAAAVEDLAVVAGVRATPVDTIVTRWTGGLPQYLPGHLDRVRAIEAGIAELDGVEVAGALLHGVGVPACVASGTDAAQRLSSAVAP